MAGGGVDSRRGGVLEHKGQCGRGELVGHYRQMDGEVSGR